MIRQWRERTFDGLVGGAFVMCGAAFVACWKEDCLSLAHLDQWIVVFSGSISSAVVWRKGWSAYSALISAAYAEAMISTAIGRAPLVTLVPAIVLVLWLLAGSIPGTPESRLGRTLCWMMVAGSALLLVAVNLFSITASWILLAALGGAALVVLGVRTAPSISRHPRVFVAMLTTVPVCVHLLLHVSETYVWFSELIGLNHGINVWLALGLVCLAVLPKTKAKEAEHERTIHKDSTAGRGGRSFRERIA